MTDSLADLALTSRLPPGWTVEAWSSDSRDGRQVLIRADHGAVSVDIDRRIFKLGYSIGPPRPYGMKYTGRGWLGRLVDDAVRALKEASR